VMSNQHTTLRIPTSGDIHCAVRYDIH